MKKTVNLTVFINRFPSPKKSQHSKAIVLIWFPALGNSTHMSDYRSKLVGGWFQPTPLKNEGWSEFVTWDDFPFPI
jgi:hypothetical protein